MSLCLSVSGRLSLVLLPASALAGKDRRGRWDPVVRGGIFHYGFLPEEWTSSSSKERKKKNKTKQGLTQGRTTQRAALEFFTLYFLKVTTGCSAGEGEGGGYYSEIPFFFFFFWITTCARVCHYVGRVGPPDWAPSLMYVCLQPPPTHTHPHAEMRSDRVMNVSAVLCTRVCVCLTPEFGRGHQSVCACAPCEVTARAWVVTPACCLIGWSVELFTLYPCAQRRGTDPLQTVASPHQTLTTHTHSPHTHTHTPLFPMLWQALLLCRHTPALPLWQAHFPDRSMVFLNKLTDVGHDGGSCPNKLKYHANNSFT